MIKSRQLLLVDKFTACMAVFAALAPFEIALTLRFEDK